MRFRFFGPDTEAEAEEHLAMLRDIDDFWRAVEGARTVLADRAAAGGLLARALARVHSGLVVEPEWFSKGALRLVIAPRDDAALGPLADTIVSRAPRLHEISVERHRQQQEPLRTFAHVKSSTGVDLTDATARAGFGRGHLIDVLVYSTEFGGANDERGLDAADMAAARLLGDEIFDDWIGAVDIVPIPRPSPLRVLTSGATGEPERFALGDLAEAVDRAVAGLRATLASEPYHVFCERAEWTLLELAPVPAEDYRGQDDLFSCATMLPEMMKCYLQGAPFASCRFSNHGERFCYLKIDMTGLNAEQRLAGRVELEEALNFALVPVRVGCVVGAGLGLRYVYIVLALEKLEAGIEIVRRALQRLGASRRSWILFCDSAWAGEWIGAYDDGPPPSQTS